MATSEYIRDVDDFGFETEVIQLSARVPVLVDFWAPWCAPCRMLGPVLEKLAGEAAGKWILAKVNIDESPRSADRYRVRGIPAVKLFVDGAVFDQFEGALPEPMLRDWLRAALPNEADAILKTVRDGLAGSDPAAARRELERALTVDPQHPGVMVTLARLSALAGDEARAEELLRSVPPVGDEGREAESVQALLDLRRTWREAGSPTDLSDPDAEKRFAAACGLAAEGRFAPALDALLGLIQSDPADWTDRAREACVKVFNIVGQDSPLAEDYRGRLSAMLY
jgi:putative thioredoxin